MTLLDAFAGTQVQIIVILIALDVVAGILASIAKKEFRFGKVAQFMKKPILAYVFGFAVVRMVGTAIPSLGFLVPAAFLLIAVAVGASIFRNLHRLGLPLPGSEKM
ncbi:MAG: phage holin family protein [bacterium]|nr:phage holin family protein [bacterium]